MPRYEENLSIENIGSRNDIRYWNYSGRDMLWKGIYAINH
jgi:hypothetical protein